MTCRTIHRSEMRASSGAPRQKPFGKAWPFLSSMCVLTILSGCNEDGQRVARQATPHVTVLAVQRAPYTVTTELAGRTEAYLISDVRPQVSGIVLERKFTEGTQVTKGEQLYQIDPATYQAAHDIAAATLDRDRALLDQANQKASRYSSLVTTSAISQQSYDDVVATSKTSAADLASAKATLQQATINLGYTKVLAPISGRIGRSSVTPGALVTSNQTTALATVTQLDPIYVDVTESATDILRLKRALDDGKLQKVAGNAAKVRLKLEDGSVYAEPGTLQFAEVNVSETTGTVTLRAIFPNAKGLLLPGMYVHAELDEGTDDNAILVPQIAVGRSAKGDATVLVVGDDEKASLRVIQAVRAVGDQWVVIGGLKPGEKVITEGLQAVRPGDIVEAAASKGA